MSCGKAERVADLMQVIAELTNERFFGSGRASSRPSAGSGSRERKKRRRWTSSRHEGIDGDHAFGFEFAEGDMNGPLIRAGGAQAVVGQIGALADAHAGVAEQQEDISAQIVAAKELLLEELILLWR